MKFYPEQLPQQLAKGLTQAYLLFGNEPLFKQECGDEIKAAAKQAGFDERHTFTIDAQIDWNQVLDCCQALSLFSSRQVIELIVPETGLNANQTKSLMEVVAVLHSDILLLLQGPRLNKKQEGAKWFKTLHGMGTYIACNTPENQHLPRFIQTRCKKLKLNADPESIQMLALLHEGNLLALVQSLDKLVLLYPDGHLTLPRLQESLSSHNHFTPFKLVDAVLAGKAKRSQRILRQLQGEGVESVILLRTLQRELTQLYKMQEMGLKGVSMNKLFEQMRIWQSRRDLYIGALHRMPMSKLIQLLQQLAQLEVQVKTDFDHQPWQALAMLCAEMCGVNTHTMFKAGDFNAS